MALSNIRVEPQREITESLIGISALVGGIGLLFVGGSIWHSVDPKTPVIAGMALSLLIVFSFVVVGFVLLFVTHALGELICGGLAKIKLDPRPKQRYEMYPVYKGDGNWQRERRPVPKK